MRNRAKANTLERMFPIYSVHENSIVTKSGDLTMCFKMELPEIFTLSKQDYQHLSNTLFKALELLPNYTVVHKQDWFLQQSYKPDFQIEDASYLALSNQRHFNERAYLNHTCYLFITKTTKKRIAQQSDLSSLTKGYLLPKQSLDQQLILDFTSSVDLFQRIINDSQLLTMTCLSENEILGNELESGILEQYFALSDKNRGSLKDLALFPDKVKVGDKSVLFHTLSHVEDLPNKVSCANVYQNFSTQSSHLLLSMASQVGLLLDCNHIYNQYLFIEDSQANLKRFEKSAKTMHSLSRYSRENQINKQWIEKYLNTAYSQGLKSIRAHFNVMAWSEGTQGVSDIKNNCASAISQMGCTPRFNTFDAPVLFWAGIPGNSGDFPREESFYTFLQPGICFLNLETNYKDSVSSFGITMCDRLTGKPIHVDLSDLPMKKGIITNRNKFILGPSGSGKSFFTNHMIRQYYEQGSHVLMVDTGNSYQGLCELINSNTQGEDGVYFTYTQESPISFNPFYTHDKVFDIEKKQSIITLLLTLWKRDDQKVTRSEEVGLSNAVSGYLNKLQSTDITPGFNSFYDYVACEYKDSLTQKKVRQKEFDLDNFLNVLEPYYCGGEYDFLLNSQSDLDLLNKRFIVFEIDSIKDHGILFPVVTIIIMEVFINKMRYLDGIRKLILIEEAWKAIAKQGMASYIKYLFKTVRKFFGEAIIVTQEVDDIISSEIVKQTIVNNSDCKILLDQRKHINKFDQIQQLLGLSEKEKNQILSLNQNNDPNRLYKEVWIGLGGVHSLVYATEVSYPEYLTFTTEQRERLMIRKRAQELNLDLESAIKQLNRENLSK
ncbi:TraG family conjugative transposon ATPase [Myroides pelagicus]|uniref:TraG family conjugative transposon ATPase n=1 Tax=Myroides pelagicus TaxID=270914 RepID=A0A7K1GQN8_9FLAO|nr:TraG family conjugative transposon ATPase [Myroides pelagicus]MEC4113423.1 TraG family conjugative transposon ATPase [Myroides pelagicus]MTH30494.1 TraG family conjugative transposon ATPase [Myroides pelagicus]